MLGELLLIHTEKTKLYKSDPQISIDDHGWDIVFNQNTHTLELSRNDEKRSIKIFNEPFEIFFPQKDTIVVIQKHKIYVQYMRKLQGRYPHEKIYVRKNGIYNCVDRQWYFTPYFDTNCSKPVFREYHNVTICNNLFICDNYKTRKSDIYLNLDDLPQDITSEMCQIIKEKSITYSPDSKKIRVHFTDKIKFINISDLKNHNSILIDEQLETSDCVYLDILYQDFIDLKEESLTYLQSKLIWKKYQTKVLEYLI